MDIKPIASINMRFESDVNTEIELVHYDGTVSKFFSYDGGSFEISNLESNSENKHADSRVYDVSNLLGNFLDLLNAKISSNLDIEDNVVEVTNLTNDGHFTSETKVEITPVSEYC